MKHLGYAIKGIGLLLVFILILSPALIVAVAGVVGTLWLRQEVGLLPALGAFFVTLVAIIAIASWIAEHVFGASE